MSVQKSAVTKAIAFLNAAGAKYTVKLGDEVFSNMPEEKKRTRSGISYKAMYAPLLTQLDNVSTATFKIPAGVEVTAVRAALSAALSTKYGKGNVITALNRKNNTIEVLRA